MSSSLWTDPLSLLPPAETLVWIRIRDPWRTPVQAYWHAASQAFVITYDGLQIDATVLDVVAWRPVT